MNTKTFLRAVVLTALLGTNVLRGDVVHDWNESALKAIRTLRTSPPQASRNLAILHTAIYDAVNGIKAPHERRFKPYLVQRHGMPKANQVAAASTAARNVLIQLFPAEQARFDAEHAAILAGIAAGRSKADGIAYGELVASAILAARENDGSTNAVAYTPAPAPGAWRPTESFGGVVRPALLPGWGMVRPFGINSVADYRPPAAPSLSSALYAFEVNQVKQLGAINSAARTADQTEIALFWANGAGTATPAGHWNVIARGIAASRGLSLDQNARLFALLNIAEADAAIVCWDCKFAYNLWRPITAIQEALGNPEVTPDPTWKPLLFTPPFPEYTSGHSTFSAAAATVLAMFFGTDDIAFTTPSEEFPALVRSFTSLSQAAEESGMSRIYGGIHFMSGNMYGLSTGQAIGEYVINNLLTRK
jgi:membrane-associated phospholipid phosphatase